MVLCIGLPPGISYFSLTWTVRSLTRPGRWHMVCCIRLTVCHPLAMPFPRPASVAIRWRLWTICFSNLLWPIVSFLGYLRCFFFLRHPLVLSFSVMFGLVSRRMSFCVPCFFVYALNVCKFSIWVARNHFQFRDVRPGAFAVLERVKSRLRFHLPLFFCRFRSSHRKHYFARQWCANGVVGSVRAGHLVLSI